MLNPGEKIEDLLRKNLSIIQNERLPKFGLEGVLLANFPKIKNGWKICDFCCGTGIVPLLLTTRAENLSIKGVELQPELSELARRSVELNNLTGQIEIINGDIRRTEIKSSFDLITVNPPFFAVSGEGSLSARSIARSQVSLSIGEVVDQAYKLLLDRGRLALIYRVSGLSQLLSYLAERNMGVIRLRFVHHKSDSLASTFLLECQKGRKSETRVEPPLIIYRDDGNLTPEMHGVYFEGRGLEGRLS